MSWFSKFKRPNAPKSASDSMPGGLHVMALGSHMLGSLHELEKGGVDLALLCARVADLHRDNGIEPCDPETFLSLSNTLDSESQKRLALTVSGLDDRTTRQTFALFADADASQQVQFLFSFAKEHGVLPIEVLMDSSLRREEFVRHFIAALGATIAGETPEVSRERLQRLDYKQLLADADRAKISASDRMAYLKKLQDEQEQKLGGRSKI